MNRAKRKLNAAFIIFIIAIISAVVVAGCTSDQPSQGNSNGATETSTIEAGVYVSDEQCLSCHGNSYEALAERTAGLGDWNPHDSIHGGYNSCANCHAKDRELTYNYCGQCHVYAPSEDVLY